MYATHMRPSVETGKKQIDQKMKVHLHPLIHIQINNELDPKFAKQMKRIKRELCRKTKERVKAEMRVNHKNRLVC